MILRDCQESDLPAILEILNDAITNSTAAWAYAPQTLDALIAAYHAKRAAGYPYIVAVDGESLLGYASLGSFRERDGYRFTVENSVYVHTDARGRGVARTLMIELIRLAEQNGYRTIIAAIGSENEPSRRLHQSLGFEFRGVLPELGYKFDRWLDLELYQLMLNSESGLPGDAS